MTAFQLLAHQAKIIAKLEVDSKRLERALEMGGELYRHDIAQLQADNVKLRECLERYCGDKCNAEYNPCEARKTLATTSQEKVARNKPDDYNMVLRREDGLHIALDIANLTITKSGVKQFTLVMGETK